MSKTVTLRHGLHNLPRKIEYFYNGLYVVINGLLTIPVENEPELHAAMLRGYNCRPDGTRIWDFNDLRNYIAASQ